MAPPYCDPGAYSYTNKRCEVNASFTCPDSRYVFSSESHLCELSPPLCATVYNPEKDMCYGSTPTCPLGSSYQCMNQNGVYKCSPYQCVDKSSGIIYTDFTPTQPTNDGTINQQGQCSGQFYIFNGKGGICREAGYDTGWTNCCTYNSGDSSTCADDSKTTQKREKKLCHSTGTYCTQKWPIVGCVQEAESYCCFSSKLARIVNEQGRPQLKAFGPDGGWGSPESPNCRGFKPDEFQMLDWSKIDLSEYFNDLIKNISQQVIDAAKTKLQNYYK